MLYISSDELPRVNPNKTQFHSHTCALLMAKCCGYSLNLVPATIHVIFVFFALSLNLVPRPSAGGGGGGGGGGGKAMCQIFPTFR